MKNNKSLKIIIVSILLLIILAILVVMQFTTNKDVKDATEDKNMIYEIDFFDGGIPGTSRDIKIYKDKVKIDITYGCSAVDCKSTTKKITKNFSKENIDKLKKFVETNFSEKLNGNKVVVIKDFVGSKEQLNLYQEDVIYSLEGGESNFEIYVEEYKYKIEYHENDDLDYFIYFKDDNSILVKKVLDNKITTYKVNFSEENMNRLNNYIEKMIEPEPDFPILWRYSKNYENSDDWFWKRYGVSEEEMYIINSIIENNESILDNLN